MERESLSQLLKKLPTLNNSRMTAHGFAVWVAWRGEGSGAVAQTFTDHGGIRLVTERTQALWFFFSTDIFLALARLEIWSRLNPMPVFVQVLPGSMLLGFKLEIALGLDVVLGNQHAPHVEEFTVIVHPKGVEAAKALPGFTFTDALKIPGLASMLWKRLSADPRLPYASSLGWFMVLKPLGNPIDKVFQAGWREFLAEIEAIASRMKIQYLIHDFFLMLPLGNLRELRTWCKEYLAMVLRARQEGTAYWPCVQAIADRKGMHFGADLPRKIPLDWDQLAPDFPHLSYRNAFLLGEGFKINDVRFKVDEGSIDDWCNVSLLGGEQQVEAALHVELPKRLVAGPNVHCFYCGQRSHILTDCPSRQLQHLEADIWEQVATLNFADIEAGLVKVDAILARNPEGLAALLHEGQDVPSLLVRAMFEIGAPFQLRMLAAVWRSMGREYPRGLRQLGPQASEPQWDALELFRQGDLVNTERVVARELFKNPRGLQLITLRGLVALERGDAARASQFFAEAEKVSTTPLQQSSCLFLQGRVLEMQGKLQQAANFYKRALQVSPRWLEATYRQGVCQVKLGFAEQAFDFFQDLIGRNPHFFNYALLDPELERGHLQMLTSLSNVWTQAQARAEEEKINAEQLKADVGKWFPPEHPRHEELSQRVDNLTRLITIENYVAFTRLVQERVIIARDLMQHVDEESRKIKGRFTNYLERLKVVQHESSWFPFPKLLLEFNKEFNFCVKNINWAQTQHFQMAENFRKASELVDVIENKVKDLEGRMKTLRIVRDSTLFVVLMFKSFLWMGLVCFVVSALALPLLGFYGTAIGFGWVGDLTLRKQIELQAGMFIILSIIALAIAAVRTALVFDARKEKLFRQAEEQAKRLAQNRASSPRRPSRRPARRSAPKTGKPGKA